MTVGSPAGMFKSKLQTLWHLRTHFVKSSAAKGKAKKDSKENKEEKEES